MGRLVSVAGQYTCQDCERDDLLPYTDLCLRQLFRLKARLAETLSRLLLRRGCISSRFSTQQQRGRLLFPVFLLLPMLLLSSHRIAVRSNRALRTGRGLESPLSLDFMRTSLTRRASYAVQMIEFPASSCGSVVARCDLVSPSSQIWLPRRSFRGCVPQLQIFDRVIFVDCEALRRSRAAFGLPDLRTPPISDGIECSLAAWCSCTTKRCLSPLGNFPLGSGVRLNSPFL